MEEAKTLKRRQMQAGKTGRGGDPVIIALATAVHRTTTENGIAPVMNAHRADVLWGLTGTGTSTEIRHRDTLILNNPPQAGAANPGHVGSWSDKGKVIIKQF